MWINFARTGNPSTSEYNWEKYDSNTRKTMFIGEQIKMVEDYKGEQRELMEPLLNYYFNGNLNDISYNVPQVYRIILQLLATLGILVGVIKLFI